MIRDIRPIQSADQDRLRQKQREDGPARFARYLKAANADDSIDSQEITRPRVPVIGQPLLRGDIMWSNFFSSLNGENANDTDSPLFHWGETRENAKQHARTAQQSARLNGAVPLHNLNEKI